MTATAGYRGLDALRHDPDLEAVRPRADFRALLRVLEADPGSPSAAPSEDSFQAIFISL